MPQRLGGSGRVMDLLRSSAVFQRLKQDQDPIAWFLYWRARGVENYMRHGHVVRSKAIAQYLADEDSPRLNLGCGFNPIAGWLNCDLITGDVYVDLNRPLPFAPGSFDYLFSEHLIEHFRERESLRLLFEMRRVLRTGGIARIATPDLSDLVQIYLDQSPTTSLEEYARYMDTLRPGPHDRPAQVLNGTLRSWGHAYVYDEADLTTKLQQAGFGAIVRVQPGVSEHPQLKDIEQRTSYENTAGVMIHEATAV